VERAIEANDQKKASKVDNAKSYSIAKIAKMLGRSHATIKKLVQAGKLRTTADGRRITQFAVQEYLQADSK
jgi:excisionase family DNA binding protein